MDLTPLIQTMEQERKIHEKILAAKKEERKLLLSLNVNGLIENTRLLASLVKNAKDFEEKRLKITWQIAQQLNMSSEEPTMREILDCLPPANRADLEKSGEALKNVVHQLQEENRINAMALQRSSDTLNSEIQSVLKTVNSGVYMQGGKKSKAGGLSRAGINLRA